MTTDRAHPLERWTSWLQATPAELVGLSLLLLGALTASGMLWWNASQRPTDLPPAATSVHPGPSAGELAHQEGGTGPDLDPGEHRTEPVDQPVAGEVVVHVSGAVVRPGLLTLPAGARVGDAIVAAGGASEDADPERLNLARPLQDGEHVHLPRQGEDPPASSQADGAVSDPPGTGSAGGVGPDGRVDLNRATPAELETLPGIGPTRAAAIVAHREEHGPFRAAGDLRAVPGIGEKTFQRLAELVTVS